MEIPRILFYIFPPGSTTYNQNLSLSFLPASCMSCLPVFLHHLHFRPPFLQKGVISSSFYPSFHVTKLWFLHSSRIISHDWTNFDKHFPPPLRTFLLEGCGAQKTTTSYLAKRSLHISKFLTKSMPNSWTRVEQFYSNSSADSHNSTIPAATPML